VRVAKEKEPELLLIIILTTKNHPVRGGQTRRNTHKPESIAYPKGELIMPQKTKNRKRTGGVE
jgi:hypothetical protein